MDGKNAFRTELPSEKRASNDNTDEGSVISGKDKEFGTNYRSTSHDAMNYCKVEAKKTRMKSLGKSHHQGNDIYQPSNIVAENLDENENAEKSFVAEMLM